MVLPEKNNQRISQCNDKQRVYPPPDLIQNLLLTENSELSKDKTINRSENQSNRHCSNQSTEGKQCRGSENPTRRNHSPLRRACLWVGWVLCCPLFSVAWMMRDDPVDRQDLREDPCLPCYA